MGKKEFCCTYLLCLQRTRKAAFTGWNPATLNGTCRQSSSFLSALQTFNILFS